MKLKMSGFRWNIDDEFLRKRERERERERERFLSVKRKISLIIQVYASE